MRKTAQQRLRDALDSQCIQPHVISAVLNTMYGAAPQKRDSTAADPAWNVLLGQLRHDLRLVKSNKQHWQPWMTSIYMEYVEVLETVVDKIVKASTTPLPDAQHDAYPTLTQYTQHTRTINARRLKENRLPLGARNVYWQTWIPLHIRNSLCLRAARVYEDNGVVKGRKFKPFLTAQLRTQADLRTTRLRSAMESVKRTCQDRGVDTAGTPFRALHLAAVRMAERTLDVTVYDMTEGRVNPVDIVIPVQWQHLLTPAMAQRLRDARANPSLVTTQGLDQFYRVLVAVESLPESNTLARASLEPMPEDPVSEPDTPEAQAAGTTVISTGQ